MLSYYRSRSLSLFFHYHELGIEICASQLIRQMLREGRSDTLRDLNDFIGNVHAVEWAASYMRDILWLHGAAGDRPGNEEEKFFLQMRWMLYGSRWLKEWHSARSGRAYWI